MVNINCWVSAIFAIAVWNRNYIFQSNRLLSSNDNNFKDCLANFISNSNFPDDLYPILLSSLILWLALKMFQYSIRLVFSLIQPIVFILIVLVNQIWFLASSGESLLIAFWLLLLLFADHFTTFPRNEDLDFWPDLDFVWCFIAHWRSGSVYQWHIEDSWPTIDNQFLSENVCIKWIFCLNFWIILG